MFIDCFMFLNTQNYKFRLQEVYFCKSSFLHHRIYIFVPHWFIFTLLTFTFFAVPFFSFTFVSAQKSKRIMCVIDQPARALYHHSIGKSDESQPEDTPHQQPPPLPPPSSGKKFLKKMDGRFPAPPSPQSVRNPDQPQSKSPGINTRTPDAEFTQQADRTPPPLPSASPAYHPPSSGAGTEKPACPTVTSEQPNRHHRPSTPSHSLPQTNTPAWKTAYERSWSTFISRRCSLQTNLP